MGAIFTKRKKKPSTNVNINNHLHLNVTSEPAKWWSFQIDDVSVAGNKCRKAQTSTFSKWIFLHIFSYISFKFNVLHSSSMWIIMNWSKHEMCMCVTLPTTVNVLVKLSVNATYQHLKGHLSQSLLMTSHWLMYLTRLASSFFSFAVYRLSFIEMMVSLFWHTNGHKWVRCNWLAFRLIFIETHTFQPDGIYL